MWVLFMESAHLTHRESLNGDIDRGDKSFSCGHPVWGLAFGPRPPKSSAAAARPAKTTPKGNKSLLLATGLENGVIKIWNVLTGEVPAREDVVCADILMLKFLFVCFQVMLCLISTVTRASWGTWSSLRTGRSRSYRLLGTRRWGFGTWLGKVCAVL